MTATDLTPEGRWPDCAKCGHPGHRHLDWWDVPDNDASPGGACGFGCAVCDCPDFEPPVPFPSDNKEQTP